MKRDSRRWLAIFVLAAIAFTQASLAFSACQLDRKSLPRAMGSAGAVAHDCEIPIATDWTKYPNRCFAHCTADLQTVGNAVALVRNPADAPVLALVRLERLPFARTGLEASPPGAPPPRILFQQFLI